MYFILLFSIEDMLGQTPLDMSQYYMLYGVHRFPEAPKDRLTFNTDSKYIVVAHNNNFFKVNQFLDVKTCFKIWMHIFQSLSTNHSIKISENFDLSKLTDVKILLIFQKKRN